MSEAMKPTQQYDKGAVSFFLSCMSRWSYARHGGNQWSGYAAVLSFARHVMKLDRDWSKWQYAEVLAEYGPRFMHKMFWISTDWPEVLTLDDDGRPHCENGPFCRWADGRELYYWHGVAVPKEWILDKASLTPQVAMTWENMEQRRVAMEIVGWLRILEECNVRTIHKDKDPMIGELVAVDLPDSPDTRFLRVLCGTKRTFALCVPNTCKTAIEANMLTYGYEGSRKEFRKYLART